MSCNSLQPTRRIDRAARARGAPRSRAGVPTHRAAQAGNETHAVLSATSRSMSSTMYGLYET